MANKGKFKLKIDYCIAIGDARRVQKGLDAIKSKRELAKQLFDRSDIRLHNLNYSNVYFKIYRYERDGYTREDKKLIEAICDILMVEREELVEELTEA